VEINEGKPLKGSVADLGGSPWAGRARRRGGRPLPARL